MNQFTQKQPGPWGKLVGKLKTTIFGSGTKPKAADMIVVVSGLPRSGTSMMMKMLEAGGIPPLTDAVRTADVDNPQGYYEFERVKKLDKGDTAWLPAARGKAVKVISMLLKHLPPDYAYRVIFMRRHLDEVLASQRQMLAHRNETGSQTSEAELARMFELHLQQVSGWLADQPNFAVIEIDYNNLLADPAEQVGLVSRLLGDQLDQEAMLGVIDPALYRKRRD